MINRRDFLGALALVSGGLVFDPFANAAADTRHWHVFVFNASHLDLGWHGLPSEIMALIDGFLADAVRLCEATKDNAPHQRYKFTLECSCAVDYHERHRSPEEFRKLIDCMRRGQIDFGAIYTEMHTDLCGHEELARTTYYAGSIRRRFSIPVEGAMLDDVGESYCMGLAQVLARSGVKWFCTGPGGKAISKGIINKAPRIFYWNSPDGSRVLSAWTPGLWTYMRYSKSGFMGEATLKEFDALPDYPYDLMFRHGGKGDISVPDPEILELIRSYQKECPEADIQLATMREFFGPLEERYADEIPSVSGDVADAWADGVISLARETALQRRAQSRLVSAEILATLGGLDVRKEMTEAYRNLHLYSDHTWGYDFDPDNRPGKIRSFTRDITQGKPKRYDVPAGETLGPGSALMKPYEVSWDAKRQYAIDASRIADQVMSRALGQIGTRTASGPAVVVWNTLSWTRTSVVRLDLPSTVRPFRALRDRRSGATIPVQSDGSSWVFISQDVPAFGCCIYDLVEGTPEKSESPKSNKLENRHYAVSFQPETGLAQSIFDRELQRELVDQDAYGMGQYIHDNVNDSYVGFGDGGMGKAGYAYGAGERYVPVATGDSTIEVGPVFSAITMHAQLKNGPAPASIQRRIILYHDLKRVDLTNRVDKRAAMEKEQIYIGFPFDVGGDPRFRLELAYMVMDWPRDLMPGTWRGFDGVRNFVRADGPKAGVTWASLDAPIVSLGGINSNHWNPQWHDSFVPANAHIYSYVMSNIWNCNYPLWQGGTMQFDYSFMSHDPSLPLSESTHFGWDAVSPLVAQWVDAGSAQSSSTLPRFEVEGQNVLITAVKRPEAGDGTILRVWECSGKSNTRARIQVVGARLANARRLNLVEEDIGPAILLNGGIELELQPHEIATLRVEFA